MAGCGCCANYCVESRGVRACGRGGVKSLGSFRQKMNAREGKNCGWALLEGFSLRGGGFVLRHGLDVEANRKTRVQVGVLRGLQYRDDLGDEDLARGGGTGAADLLRREH